MMADPNWNDERHGGLTFTSSRLPELRCARTMRPNCELWNSVIAMSTLVPRAKTSTTEGLGRS
jgi:hypothetical protein